MAATPPQSKKMAASPSPPPPPLLLTPKPEPLDDSDSPNPNPNQLITSSSSLTNYPDQILSDYTRLSNQYALIFSKCSNDQTSMAMTLHPDEQTAPPSKKKKKSRADAMVRVPELNPLDYLQYRTRIRQTRLMYESLRSFYHLNYLSNNLNLPIKIKKPRNRSDLKASGKMKELGFYLNNEKDLRIVGPVPGVEIGDIFFYRAELMVLGLHNQIQGGIGYVPADLVPQGVPIATSIVASGGYQDDKELSDDVIMYTGSGGRIKNQTHVSCDQSLQRGNLALEKSMQFGIEIRVFRGLTLNLNPLKKVYVYDGLYRVIESNKIKSKSKANNNNNNYNNKNDTNNNNYNNDKVDCSVYLFKLVRVRNQVKSSVGLIRNCQKMKEKLLDKILLEGYVSIDISNGIEGVIIPYFNNIDEEKYPLMFEYVKSPEYPLLIKPKKGCECKNTCDVNCPCVVKNNGLVYDYNGVLLKGRNVVYECGDTCLCGDKCRNKVTQKGVKLQLEVFRSNGNIWGVRSLDIIQAGTFICEFSGDFVLREDLDANSNSNLSLSLIDSNLNLIDPRKFPERWREFGNVSSFGFRDSNLGFENSKLGFGNSNLGFGAKSEVVMPEYFLDVSRRRNVACYISHSCNPNLFVQFVLYGHDCVKYPRMMLFALENIPPMRELSLDYGVSQEQIH